MKCIGPEAKGADLWILIWEEMCEESINEAHSRRFNTSKRVDPVRQSNKCRSSANLSLKEMKKRTDGQHTGQCWKEEK